VFWNLKAWTLAQKQAVESMYLNPRGETQKEMAKRLGISFDSLRDRRDGAILKLSKLLSLTRISKRREKGAAPPIESDLLYCGLYSKKSAAQIHQLYEFDFRSRCFRETEPTRVRSITSKELNRLRIQIEESKVRDNRVNFLQEQSSELPVRGRSSDFYSSEAPSNRTNSRIYRGWKEAHADAQEALEQLKSAKQKPVIDESHFKIPLSPEELKMKENWVSHYRLRDPACIQLKSREMSDERLKETVEVKPMKALEEFSGRVFSRTDL